MSEGEKERRDWGGEGDCQLAGVVEPGQQSRREGVRSALGVTGQRTARVIKRTRQPGGHGNS